LTVNLGVDGISIVNDFTFGVKIGRNRIGCVVQVEKTLALKYVFNAFLAIIHAFKIDSTNRANAPGMLAPAAHFKQ
jgi:hypothetical protein